MASTVAEVMRVASGIGSKAVYPTGRAPRGQKRSRRCPCPRRSSLALPPSKRSAQDAGVKHWLWRAVDQAGVVLDVLVQRRRDTQAAKRMLRKLLKKQMRPPRVMITDKLASYGAAKRDVMPGVEH